MSPIEDRPMWEINEHYFQKNKEKILKSSRNFKIKNLINYFILLYFDSTFFHLRLDSTASAIEDLNRTEF